MCLCGCGIRFWDALLRQRTEDTKPDLPALQAQQLVRSIQACAFFMLELGLEGHLYWPLLNSLAGPTRITHKQQVTPNPIPCLM